MNIKPVSANKVICSLLLAVCCLFASCIEQPEPGNPYYNPNSETSRVLRFSHNSGLYSQSFSLSITAPAGSSIYYSIDGSIPSPEKAGNGFVFKYNSPITVQNRNGQANVLASPANATQMYGEPGDRGNNMPSVYIPSNNQVPKATVIRAIAVDAVGNKSGVLTKTYFIGDNLANFGNNRIISLVSDPYNLIDQNYGIMVRGDPNNRWEGSPYNFQKKGQDWERPAFLELFEGSTNSRSVKLSTEVGIRVRGGWSRAAGQKSFSVYFKEQYGINNLTNYNLIPGAVKADGTPVGKFKGFMLRNGANDSDYTKFYDVFLQELLSDRSFSTQASVPCVVYLNGEYWGPYNLQERYSDNHTEYKYGVKKENVISYDNGELDDGNPGEEALFLNLADGVINGTISYADFCNAFDIDNFIDYWAAEIYIYNEDWPHNNYRLWRTRTVESGNHYGDTKWRYQMFDTEFSMGIYNSGRTTGQENVDAFYKILNYNTNNHNNKLFKALLANEDFCRKFVNTMMDLYNVNFHPDSYDPLLNKYANTYRPLMGDTSTPGTYFSRWGRPWDSVFQNKLDEAGRYLNSIRDAMVNDYLPTYFGGYSGIANIGISGSNLCDVTISSTISGTSIKVNTVTVSGSCTVKYYRSNPITVTASAPPSGYEFDSWTVIGGSADNHSTLTTTVNLTSGNVQITAKYKPAGVAVVPATGITLSSSALTLETDQTSTLIATVTPNNATYKTVIWSSSDSSVATVDGGGKITAVKSGTATITASTVDGTHSAQCAVTVTRKVLLDLAAKLQTLSTGTISSLSAFGGAITPSGEIGSHVTYSIISEGGIKKLQVNEIAMWGVGFDIKNLQAGDTVEVKGKYLGGQSDGMQFLMDFTNWQPIERWILSPGEDFQYTVNITTNGDARLRTNGKDPWKNPGEAGYESGYTANFVVEQVKVYR